MVYHSYQDCRDATLHLRQRLALAKTVTAADEGNGQWVWRVDLDGSSVAVSSRSYFRVRECQPNLGRFLAAVPDAPTVDGVRVVHHIPEHLVLQAKATTRAKAMSAGPA